MAQVHVNNDREGKRKVWECLQLKCRFTKTLCRFYILQEALINCNIDFPPTGSYYSPETNPVICSFSFSTLTQ